MRLSFFGLMVLASTSGLLASMGAINSARADISWWYELQIADTDSALAPSDHLVLEIVQQSGSRPGSGASWSARLQLRAEAQIGEPSPVAKLLQGRFCPLSFHVDGPPYRGDQTQLLCQSSSEEKAGDRTRKHSVSLLMTMPQSGQCVGELTETVSEDGIEQKKLVSPVSCAEVLRYP